MSGVLITFPSLQQVIAQTAGYVREAGGQSEFRLGVAQAGNPNFAFLHPADRLFPYYRWLLQAAPDDSTAARSASLQGGTRSLWCVVSCMRAARAPFSSLMSCSISTHLTAETAHSSCWLGIRVLGTFLPAALHQSAAPCTTGPRRLHLRGVMRKRLSLGARRSYRAGHAGGVLRHGSGIGPADTPCRDAAAARCQRQRH